MIKTLLILILFILSACSTVPTINCSPKAKNGIPIYEPQPYILISLNKQASIEYIPDMTKPCKLNPGSGILGSNQFTLSHGWNYLGSQTQSNLTSLLGSLAPIAATLTGSVPLMARRISELSPGLYKLNLTKNPPTMTKVELK